MAYPSPSDVPVAENMDSQPRILLLGLRSSGKSSIQKVVFHKMPPGDTMNLESTNQIVKEDITSGSFIQFQIWDCPGQNDFSDSSLYDLDYIFGTRGALIFVIDAQDDCNEALRMLNRVFTNAYNVNKNLKFEVFIHKIDGIPEDQKLELQRYILYTASEELKESGIHGLHLSIHLTSIYDHTIFEAFSKVVQKLVKSLSVLENMLTMFSNNSGVDKVFLFDIVSKIYIATDVNQVENELYELCCDMIDVTLDISCVYGEGDDDVENSGFDHESGALIRLNTNFVLYLREVNRHLAVVCIISDANFQRRGTIDYNLGILRKKINDILEANKNSEKLKNNSAVVEDANGDEDLSNNIC